MCQARFRILANCGDCVPWRLELRASFLFGVQNAQCVEVPMFIREHKLRTEMAFYAEKLRTCSCSVLALTR